MKTEQIPTPSLILDIDVAQNNHKHMLDILSPLNISLRPHYKSHKSTYIAYKQLEWEAKGITCAKISEAKDLVLSGIKDVLIANQVIDKAKIYELAHLASLAKITVCVDDAENIKAMNDAAKAFDSYIHCLVEYDIGMNRCGVLTHRDAICLAKEIMNCSNLVFDGIQAYAGQLAHESDFDKRKDSSLNIENDLRTLLYEFSKEGIDVKVVSGISTGTVELRPENSVYTEAQCGSYLFMDSTYEKVGVSFEHSLYMLTQVISRDDDHFVCDAGIKSLGVDQGLPVFVGYENAKIELSEEHVAACIRNDVKVGDKLLLIPGHCCTTINLHDWIYIVSKGEVIDRIPVTSRGKCM